MFHGYRYTAGIVVGIGLMLGLTGPVVAGPWTSNASGANAAFGWSGGTSNTNAFGNPTVTEAGFLFLDPVDFRADGGGGATESVTDFARVTVDVTTAVPAAAVPIDFVRVTEWGTWSSDVSNPATDFGFQLDYSIFRLAPAPLGNTGAIDVDPVFNPDGTWMATYTLNAGGAAPPFSDVPWSRLQITVTNTVQVPGAAPAGTFIEKQGMQIIVPEPATMALVFVGIGSLAFRRTRR